MSDEPQKKKLKDITLKEVFQICDVCQDFATCPFGELFANHCPNFGDGRPLETKEIRVWDK